MNMYQTWMLWDRGKVPQGHIRRCHSFCHLCCWQSLAQQVKLRCRWCPRYLNTVEGSKSEADEQLMKIAENTWLGNNCSQGQPPWNKKHENIRFNFLFGIFWLIRLIGTTLKGHSPERQQMNGSLLKGNILSPVNRKYISNKEIHPGPAIYIYISSMDSLWSNSPSSHRFLEMQGTSCMLNAFMLTLRKDNSGASNHHLLANPILPPMELHPPVRCFYVLYPPSK